MANIRNFFTLFSLEEKVKTSRILYIVACCEMEYNNLMRNPISKNIKKAEMT